MRVLYLCDTLENGGAERQLTILATYLPAEWDKQVWSMSDGPYKSILKNNGVNVHIGNRAFSKDITPSFKLWKLIIEWHPDIIHSWGWMSTASAIPICKIMKIPLIDGTIRAGFIPLQGRYFYKFIKKYADSVIANSQAGLDAFHIPAPKGVVIHNGFDPVRLHQCNQQKSKPSNVFRVIMTGRMSWEKDYQTFFEAARRINKIEPGSWLFIAFGHGHLRQSIIDTVVDLLKLNVVEFPEPGIEVLQKVCEANIGVLLTNNSLHAEGCSNSIMEYMACGLPVVCTDSGGNSELVEQDITGFLIESGNVTSLVEKLLWLKRNPNEAKIMGAAGKQIINTCFSVEKLVENTVEVYKKVLKT